MLWVNEKALEAYGHARRLFQDLDHVLCMKETWGLISGYAGSLSKALERKLKNGSENGPWALTVVIQSLPPAKKILYLSKIQIPVSHKIIYRE